MADHRQKNLFGSEATVAEPMPWEVAAESDLLAAQVVFNRPLQSVYQYRVPDMLRPNLAPGKRVKVPFGRGDRVVTGYCVGLTSAAETGRELKTIRSIVDREPLLSSKMLGLTRWIAQRYLCSWGQVLEVVVPAGVKNKAGTRVVQFVQPTESGRAELAAGRLPRKQRAALEALCAVDQPLRVDDLRQAANCTVAPIDALRKKRLIESVRQRTENFAPEPQSAEMIADLQLNAAQQRARDSIHGALRAGEHRTILLYGVTGSGKTEIYIQTIREVASYGRQAIVLVPEISLTPQTIRRFRSRFDGVAVLHSHLSDAERRWQWQRISRGEVQVVVGARSAVFAPTPHLGLIVIDEEHETTFKQETTPRYHAREVARERARMENVPLVLGSATPTLESWLRVQQRQDELISLPQRVGGLPLPPVVVVDVRNDPHTTRGACIGRALQSAMRASLEAGGQIILLLNLRGYSPTLWCRACGQAVKCPHCDITLTWHRDRDVALCHGCDFHRKRPAQCPNCGHGGMAHLGTGTQRLEHEVRAKFPGASVLRMDSDSMRRPGSHDAALESFRRGDVQILLGTQMIAKGLDFPDVTLVGVVNADTTLHQPDLRAAERTFQLISQVAGRTGRSTRGGRVFVQTTSPAEACVVKASEHDYESFARHELEHRRRLQTAPFRSLARVIVRGADESAVQAQATAAAELFRKTAESIGIPVRILGPAVAPVGKLKKNYRHHCLLAADEIEAIHRLWHEVSGELPKAAGVDLTVDVEPLDMR